MRPGIERTGIERTGIERTGIERSRVLSREVDALAVDAVLERPAAAVAAAAMVGVAPRVDTSGDAEDVDAAEIGFGPCAEVARDAAAAQATLAAVRLADVACPSAVAAVAEVAPEVRASLGAAIRGDGAAARVVLTGAPDGEIAATALHRDASVSSARRDAVEAADAAVRHVRGDVDALLDPLGRAATALLGRRAGQVAPERVEGRVGTRRVAHRHVEGGIFRHGGGWTRWQRGSSPERHDEEDRVDGRVEGAARRHGPTA